ncbi:hypothetical protein ACFL27_24285 [candidate division CSSED10-310 bacterium]|uniref:ABC-2 type transporter domain-containing protein n=1 Tax=candidate division CSSED10-310 bacterium TaxID=2855610 RepID=A0ABV6Z4F1_UNCC1
MIKQLLIFLRYKIIMLWHEVENFTLEKAFKLFVFVLIGIAFILFDFLFFWRIISQVMNMPELGVLRYAFIIRLLNMVFIMFLGMVLFSNIVASLSTFFLSKDMDFLLSSPTHLFALFFHKFLETFLNSSWMVILFGMPIFIAYGLVLGAKSIFYLLLLLILIPFLIIPAAIGIVITILLMRYFPAKRTHQVIAFLGLFFGAGIVVVIRLMRPEEFIKPIGAERLASYLIQVRIPTSPLLPSTWASESMMSLIDRKWMIFQENMLLLWLSAVALLYVSYLVARALYPSAYSRSQEGGSPNPRKIDHSKRGYWERVFSHLRPQVAAFFIKDVKSFFRETTQWSQIFLLGAIIFVYLFNVRNVPIYSWFLANFAAFLNVGMAGFVLAALCARFVFPSISIEGHSFWIVHSSPLSYRRFMIEKFLFYLLPLLFLSELLIIVSNHFLNVDAYMRVWSMVMIFFITLANVGLGVGLGSIYPRFRVENAAQIAVGAGGIIYMLISLFYLLLIIVLEASPVYLHFQSLLKGTSFGLQKSLIFHVSSLVLSLLVIIIPPWLGVRSLNKMEYYW